MEKWRPKMARFHREKKEEAIWKSVIDGQTSGQTEGQTESIVDNNDSWLGAEINNNYCDQKPP